MYEIGVFIGFNSINTDDIPDTPQDVIFGNFQLQSSFCAPVNNNNSELLNHNHSKLNQNGSQLFAF